MRNLASRPIYMICLFLFSLLMGLLTLSFAETAPSSSPYSSIGQVVWVKGVLKANLPNQPVRVLVRRSVIFEKDTLATDGASTGEVIFTDNSLLSLRENTKLAIAQYKFGKNTPPAEDSYVASLTKGGFRTITGAISKNHPDGYSTKTPVATIGVMGTDYSIFFTPGAKGLAAQLNRGAIKLKNAAGEIILKKCTPQQTKQANCKNQLYARVTSATTAPTAVSQKPEEFNNDVPIIGADAPCPFCSISSKTGTINTGGIVSSFCIK